MKMQICFWIKKNSNLHLRKMQICFCFKKNLDLHLRKMQICFCFKKKNYSHADYWNYKKDHNNCIKIKIML